MKPSTGAAVRLHRNAVRDRPESLSAFKWNACPPSPEYPLPARESAPVPRAGRRAARNQSRMGCYSVGLQRKVQRGKRALPEFPLARNAIVAVGHDHTHRPTDPRVSAVSIELSDISACETDLAA